MSKSNPRLEARKSQRNLRKVRPANKTSLIIQTDCMRYLFFSIQDVQYRSVDY